MPEGSFSVSVSAGVAPRRTPPTIDQFFAMRRIERRRREARGESTDDDGEHAVLGVDPRRFLLLTDSNRFDVRWVDGHVYRPWPSGQSWVPWSESDPQPTWQDVDDEIVRGRL